jgi:histidine triad (HIT) family protein
MTQQTPDDLTDVFRLVRQVAERDGVADVHGLVVNTGRGAGQTAVHVHIHELVGTRPSEEWPL